MKLLLCKNVDRLGIVGDIVTVSSGYARNYLLPHGLATTPTRSNMRALAAARRVAEQERAKQRAIMEELARRLEGVEVTIRAKANEAGVLYGSVGKKEIAHALAEEGYGILPEQVVLSHPLRQLDNVEVELRFAPDLKTSVKVWVVREKAAVEGEEGEAEAQAEPAAEAAPEDATDGDDTEN
jgi:large subunit ribosomal protein L9